MSNYLEHLIWPVKHWSTHLGGHLSCEKQKGKIIHTFQIANRILPAWNKDFVKLCTIEKKKKKKENLCSC